MNDRDHLLRKLNTLGEAIRLDWQGLAPVRLSQAERSGIRQHISSCVNEIKDLLGQLESQPAPQGVAVPADAGQTGPLGGRA
jgi:hypothetical protein